MGKFYLDGNLEAWVSNIQVEADSLEEAIAKVDAMSLQELLDSGAYIKESELRDVDYFSESSVEVHVKSVDYDIDEEDLDALDIDFDDIDAAIEKAKAELPQEFDLLIDDVDLNNEADLEEKIADEISNKTGYLINSFEYEII